MLSLSLLGYGNLHFLFSCQVRPLSNTGSGGVQETGTHHLLLLLDSIF